VSTKKSAKAADSSPTSRKVAKKKVPVSKNKKTALDAVPDALNDADYADYDDSDNDSEPEPVRKSTVVRYERKSGHYMDATQLAHFSKKLAAWKQQLMEEVDRTVGHMKDDATNFPDPNDRATQEEEFSLELRTRDRERKLIKKINEAQKRIDDDEYGYCENCGIEIGVNRLEARPTAELCIDCKTLEEIRERQTA
jgi:DnaK suppressor protein